VAQLAVAAVGGWLALAVTITLIGRGSIWAVLAGVSLAVWVWYFYRLVSMAVFIRGDTLTVRNLLRTRHIARASIAEVTLGDSTVAKAPNQTVIVETSSGQRFRLEACARSLQSPRKRRRVEEFQRRVAAWSAPELPEAPTESEAVELTSVS
jgi:hypothetical protein